MMTHDEMIAVIAAHRDWKTIQAKGRDQEWEDVKLPPLWNFQHNDYRIKPEPLVLWVAQHDNGEYYAMHKDKSVIANLIYNESKYLLTLKKFVEATE